MSDLADLYQEVILDHGKRPRNFGEPEVPCTSAEGFNPLCGDRLRVYADVEDGHITSMCFTGAGCAICMASASMMTSYMQGRDLVDARCGFDSFQAYLTSGAAMPESMDKLQALGGVRKYPMRVKCATLPWHTMLAAINHSEETATTE